MTTDFLDCTTEEDAVYDRLFLGSSPAYLRIPAPSVDFDTFSSQNVLADMPAPLPSGIQRITQKERPADIDRGRFQKSVNQRRHPYHVPRGGGVVWRSDHPELASPTPFVYVPPPLKAKKIKPVDLFDGKRR